MSSLDDLETRQKDELNVLKSTHPNELKVLSKKAAWNHWVPLDLLFSLKPNSEEVYVSLDFHVVCSEQYPNEPPRMHFEKVCGLSDLLLCKLKEELDTIASRYLGEVMIYQLVMQVEEFLFNHNKPGKKSLHEEMMREKEERELKEREAIQQENERNNIDMREEIIRRKSEQTRRIGFSESLEDDSEESLEESSSSETLKSFVWGNRCEAHTEMKSIEFRYSDQTVTRGECIKHINEKCVLYFCYDKNGRTLCLTEWVIDKSEVDLDLISVKMNGIQSEVNNRLTQLRYPYLCSYIDVQKCEDTDCIYIYLLREYVRGTDCNMLLNKIYDHSLQFIRHITKGIVDALACLHRNHIVHKDLNLSCIHLEEPDSIVKVSNYSIFKRICDLVCPPLDGHSNYSKKGDIYDLGLLLISLWNKVSMNGENISVPSDMPSVFSDFVSCCLSKKESILDLSRNKFLRDEISSLPLRRTSSPDRIWSQVGDLDRESMFVSNLGRIECEYIIQEELGKGGFGCVYKAINKLDGNSYAVKIIRLKARKSNLITRIAREVKLLSRLNHENIVRYFCSWIDKARSEDTPIVRPQSNLAVVNSNEESIRESREGTDLVIVRDCRSESLIQPTVASDEEDEDNEDDSDDVDDDNAFGRIQSREDDSDDFIEFKDGDKSRTVEDTKELVRKNRKSPTESSSRNKDQGNNLVQHLYIQMEFCEKNTLRTAIDDNLYKRGNKVWMLFREIVEGLAYIHEQGMMHRDLKPDNIFLDSKGHIKIGDFGLATHIVRKVEGPRPDSDGELAEDESKTGAVGTPLYVAPELTSVNKVSYNEKVDIYSLGIILFEMWHPMKTKMERFNTVTILRCKDISFPKEFERKDTEKQRFLIRWLLNHDGAKRPSSHELLKSEHLPPPEREEEDTKKFIASTVKNPQSKYYKFLISSCFDQDVTPADDVMYDHDESLTVEISSLQVQKHVKEILKNIFAQYGGVELSTPLPMPKCNKFYLYDEKDPYLKLMSHDGGMVSLPYDLRIPFARYIAWEGLTTFRRYCIERVYKHKIVKFKPLETWECSFDIVTPSNSNNLIPDAEILFMSYEILSALRMVSNCSILLNHTALFEAILLQYNILDKKEALITFYNEVQEGMKPKSRVKDKLIEFGLPTSSINTLSNLLNDKIYLSKIPIILQQMKRKADPIGSETRKALEQLDAIVDILKDCKIDIALAPGLLYQANHFDGMICQVVCTLKKKHNSTEVIATGGRYDAAVGHYIEIMKRAGIRPDKFEAKAVGILFSVDKLCNIMQMDVEETRKLNVVDVIVCSISSNPLIKEKLSILNGLRSAGISCCLVDCENDDEVRNRCIEMKTRHAVLINEVGAIKIKNFEKERVNDEKPVKMSDLVEKVQSLMRLGSQERSGQNSLSLSRSESRTSNSERTDQMTSCDLLIHFVGTMIQPHNKKQYDHRIRTTFKNLLGRLRGTVLVIALNCETQIVNVIATQLNLSEDETYQSSIKSILERHPRQRNLEDICGEIYAQKKKNHNVNMIIIYSLSESSHKMMLNI